MMGVTIKYALSALVFAIPASFAQAGDVQIAKPLNLACSGTSDTTEYINEEHIRSQDSDVRLYLSGDGGYAEIPKFIGGAKEGRQIVRFFTVSDTMITGKINYQVIGNAKMRLDRVAGTLSITGPRGNFSGRCRPFTPEEATPKF